MTDTKLFIANVKYMLKRQHRRLGDMERKIGRSAGYLSRLRGSISLDDAVKISRYCACSLEDLLNKGILAEIERESIMEQIKELEARLEKLGTDQDDLG